ncbi:hypothetical protein [Portibacter lacus]|uniref:Uncharacterized protein n=1 Tax=Portibacter lacus TaxID=1099794 RepID=A0AA37SW84_9BACT|nr:hypothetical protein [Portibacter lacus]GLR19956.1 hypothetical protein GCM10007940_45720 [Portibacter lacus]
MKSSKNHQKPAHAYIKAHRVVKTSWKIGKVAHLSNPILRRLRNQALRMTPDSVSRKQNEMLYELVKV